MQLLDNIISDLKKRRVHILVARSLRFSGIYEFDTAILKTQMNRLVLLVQNFHQNGSRFIEFVCSRNMVNSSTFFLQYKDMYVSSDGTKLKVLIKKRAETHNYMSTKIPLIGFGENLSPSDLCFLEENHQAT